MYIAKKAASNKTVQNAVKKQVMEAVKKDPKAAANAGKQAAASHYARATPVAAASPPTGGGPPAPEPPPPSRVVDRYGRAWDALWDAQSQRPYYVDSTTGQTAWEVEVAQQPPPPPQPPRPTAPAVAVVVAGEEARPLPALPADPARSGPPPALPSRGGAAPALPSRGGGSIADKIRALEISGPVRASADPRQEPPPRDGAGSSSLPSVRAHIDAYNARGAGFGAGSASTAPAPAPAPAARMCAIHAFDATEPWQLSLSPGQIYGAAAAGASDDGWIELTNSNGDTGQAPAAYLKACEAPPESAEGSLLVVKKPPVAKYKPTAKAYKAPKTRKNLKSFLK